MVSNCKRISNVSFLYRLLFILLKGQNVHKGKEEPVLTSDIESRINSDAPVEIRLKTLKELNEAVLNNRLEEVSIAPFRYLFAVPYGQFISFFRMPSKSYAPALKIFSSPKFLRNIGT